MNYEMKGIELIPIDTDDPEELLHALLEREHYINLWADHCGACRSYGSVYKCVDHVWLATERDIARKRLLSMLEKI